jgi:hypothetical protein
MKFLDNHDNIWNANACTKTSCESHSVLVLKASESEVTDEC